MNEVDRLFNFIDQATKSGEYSINISRALAGALRLVASVMTKDELNAEPFPVDRLDSFLKRIVNRPNNTYKAESLVSYRSRILRLLRNYNQRGAKGVAVPKKVRAPKLSANQESPANPQSNVNQKLAELHLPLPGDRYILVRYPQDIDKAEADMVGGVLGSIGLLTEQRRRHGS